MRPYLVFFLLSFQSLLLAADNSLLAQSPSPYLQAHKDDKVNWQLLSTDVIQQAKRDNRLILLSSGYSSCNWCYRMKDTFRDSSTSQYINTHFTPILIDRELEPEVDQYLQYFMEQVRGFGGWPVTVVFTPDALPAFGFNYMTADKLQPLLKRFVTDWETSPQDIQNKAKARHQQALSEQQKKEILLKNFETKSIVKEFVEQAQMAADNQYGGFGQREKFPHIPQLSALLSLHQQQTDKVLLDFLTITTSAILGGSLHDHLSGGFFRYTSDEKWTYPHYEQMLYTQAMMAEYLIEMGQTFKQARFSDAGKATLLHMIQQFRRDDGLFSASLSATGVDGKVASYYLWTQKEIDDVIGEQATTTVHNLLGHEAKKILPFISKENAVARNKLLSKRQQRKQFKDDKALLGWNALALSALAKGSHLDPAIKQAADTLGSKLQGLLEKDTLPKLINVADSPSASFSDYVYLAKGLQDWASARPDNTALDKSIPTLLQTSYDTFYTSKGWVKNTNKPLIGAITQFAIQDTELPSPSALWLDSVWQLNDKSARAKKLHSLANKVSAKIPQAVEDNAFFHASLVSALVGQ